MARDPVTLHWPNGRTTTARPGSDWLAAAQAAGFPIPTGCLGGSCGACAGSCGACGGSSGACGGSCGAGFCFVAGSARGHGIVGQCP